MSGRLVILPKKSYCPWNPDNVERVLRDERLAKEQEEKETKTQQQEESQQRWNRLKQAKNGSDSNYNTEIKRFCLFEEEEKQQQCNLTKGPPPKQVGVMPVFLGESLSREKKRKAAQEEERQGDAFLQKETRRKTKMDPMKRFARECNQAPQSTSLPRDIQIDDRGEKKEHRCHRRREESSDSESSEDSYSRRKQRRKKKHKKKHKRRDRETQDSDSDSDTDESSRKRRRRKRKKSKNVRESSPKLNIAELRKRRLEREQKEQKREREAIREASKGVLSRRRC